MHIDTSALWPLHLLFQRLTATTSNFVLHFVIRTTFPSVLHKVPTVLASDRPLIVSALILHLGSPATTLQVVVVINREMDKDYSRAFHCGLSDILFLAAHQQAKTQYDDNRAPNSYDICCAQFASWPIPFSVGRRNFRTSRLLAHIMRPTCKPQRVHEWLSRLLETLTGSPNLVDSEPHWWESCPMGGVGLTRI